MMNEQLDGAPTVHMVSSEKRRARKDHICGICNGVIAKGSEYHRQAWVEDGKLISLKSHDSSGACALFSDEPSTECPACGGSGYLDAGSPGYTEPVICDHSFHDKQCACPSGDALRCAVMRYGDTSEPCGCECHESEPLEDVDDPGFDPMFLMM